MFDDLELADALVSVFNTLRPTEESDLDLIIKLLASGRTDLDRRADLRLFRDQIINAAAGEMYALLTEEETDG